MVELDAKGLRAANAVYARGLRISLRKDNIDNDQKPALDLSHASINGPLFLSAHDSERSAVDRFRRTIVSGSVSFEGLSAKEVKLEGMVIGGNLNCNFSEISGGMWLTRLFRSPISWRTFVYGSLDLSRARVGFLYLDGCRIGHGIDLTELRARSIYGCGCRVSRLDGKSRVEYGLYRNWIGGDFQASGAVIDNVVEMQGARVFGEIRFITGRCGRLSLTVHPWWEGDVPRFTPCEAHGLALFNFTIDRNVGCVGLRLTSQGSHSTWSKGGVLTHDLRIGGSLQFWHSEQFKRLKQKLGKPPNGNTVAINTVTVEDAIAKSIAKVRAEVQGIMDLEGVHIEGTVNLSRTQIKGSINLTNANVGDSLLICDEESDLPILTCTGLNALNMQVGGDADLRRLTVKTSINLQDVEVGGILRLATADAQDFEPAASVKEGSIDLSGVHAS